MRLHDLKELEDDSTINCSGKQICHALLLGHYNRHATNNEAMFG